jgi:hypothetical protein
LQEKVLACEKGTQEQFGREVVVVVVVAAATAFCRPVATINPSAINNL